MILSKLVKEIKIKLKKIWSDITWEIYKFFNAQKCKFLYILDLRGNEQVDPLYQLLIDFNDVINNNGYIIVQWKNTFYTIEKYYPNREDDSFNWSYGEELTKTRAYLLGLYTRIDRWLK